MEPIGIGFVFAAILAGFFMFLAPCTLPLVPGYLAFISGVDPNELSDPARMGAARRRVFLNGLCFVLGFSLIFILLGAGAGFFGGAIGPIREILGRVGGALILFFGLFMLGLVRLPVLESDRRIGVLRFVVPGRPQSSILIGMAFAIGWTPCIGPILATILLFATTSATATQGALLLTAFSLGMAIPFLVLAAAVSSAARVLLHADTFLLWTSRVGGAFLILLGMLLLTGTFGYLNEYAFGFFEGYEEILDFL
jgi:cytochrome c-type biogenesis protein